MALQNLRIFSPLENGEDLSFNYSNGRELIRSWIPDDWTSPPTGLVLEATAADGRRVRIGIPYDKASAVVVQIVDAEQQF